MWQRLTAWIARCSADWRLVAGVGLCQMLLLVAMLQIGKPFQLATGYPPFDFQSTLTVADMQQQLAHYTPAARQLYYGMSAIDFIFPALGGLFWALLMAAGLHLGWPDFWQRPNNKIWLLLPFTGTLCDWSENVGLLVTISHYPSFERGFASFAVLAKQGKNFFVSLAMAAALALLLAGALRYGLRRRAS
jgi:hypothetical protein